MQFQINSKIFIAIMLFSFINEASSAIDPLLGAIRASSSAMRAQGERLKVIAENLANEDSLGLSPGADPYRRKTITLTSKYDDETGVDQVVVKKISTDDSDFILKYDPSHIAADSNGYVKYPNVNKIIESADAKEAQRSYEANMSTIEISRSMINNTLNLLR